MCTLDHAYVCNTYILLCHHIVNPWHAGRRQQVGWSGCGHLWTRYSIGRCIESPNWSDPRYMLTLTAWCTCRCTSSHPVHTYAHSTAGNPSLDRSIYIQLVVHTTWYTDLCVLSGAGCYTSQATAARVPFTCMATCTHTHTQTHAFQPSCTMRATHTGTTSAPRSARGLQGGPLTSWTTRLHPCTLG